VWRFVGHFSVLLSCLFQHFLPQQTLHLTKYTRVDLCACLQECIINIYYFSTKNQRTKPMLRYNPPMHLKTQKMLDPAFEARFNGWLLSTFGPCDQISCSFLQMCFMVGLREGEGEQQTIAS